jgi:hypothetical protein
LGVQAWIRRLARFLLQLDEKRVYKRGPTAQRPEERLLNKYVLLLAYLLLTGKGLGYLALTWSTVVLLGGFVTSLQRTDFWCLTIISMIQLARSVRITFNFATPIDFNSRT